MLQLNKDQQRLPIGGHHYPSYGMTFRGETMVEVAKKLGEYRLTNNYPIGEPQQDVLGYYAKNWPFMVKNVESEVIETQDDDYVNWRDWVFRTWKKPPSKFLSGAEIKPRLEVCETCPFNKEINWSRSEELTEVLKRAFILKRGMPTPENIGYCACHRADLSTLVFIENAAGFSNKLNETTEPKACWVSKIEGNG